MSDERDERMAAEDDAKEDLELNEENADQVRGGVKPPPWYPRSEAT